VAGLHTTEDLQARVTVDDLREVYAHGDPDLETRYRTRVAALIALANAEVTTDT
jgi:hypothetical protein